MSYDGLLGFAAGFLAAFGLGMLALYWLGGE